MIHILFMILKVLGILLLVLLLLALLVICSVPFIPLCYRAHLQKEEEGVACVQAQGRISWLFGAAALHVSYENQKMEVQIRIFGVPLETWKQRLKKIRRGEALTSKAEKRETRKSETEKTDRKNEYPRPEIKSFYRLCDATKEGQHLWMTSSHGCQGSPYSFFN